MKFVSQKDVICQVLTEVMKIVEFWSWILSRFCSETVQGSRFKVQGGNGTTAAKSKSRRESLFTGTEQSSNFEL